MKDKEPQSSIVGFLNENLKLPTPKELAKRRIRVKAKWHLEEFFRLFLDSVDKNSIDGQIVFLYILRTLKKMENRDICYIKTMPNKRPRIFKKFYCYLGLEKWKKCPEYFCPCDNADECPHNQPKNG